MQSLLILLAILLGIVFPFAHQLTFLIRYTLMVMLFFAFLNVRFDREMLHRNHLAVLAANLLLPLLVYALLRPLGQTPALAAFVVALAPTAAGAPVIAAFLRCRVDFVTTSVLITSPAMAIVIPLLLPHFVAVQTAITVGAVLAPTAAIVFIPLVISQVLRRTLPKVAGRLNRWRGIAFYLFLANVHIASARATRFIGYESSTPWTELLLIAGMIGLLCLLQFQLGERLAHPSLRLENSLALGRKNTMFALWIALTFINPVVALGPIFQILWQNAYNSWQLYEVERRNKVPGAKVPGAQVSGPKNPEK